MVLTALLCSNALLPARRRRATALRGSSSDVWQAMKLVDLKAACRRRGLKVSGTKAELVARLSDAPDATKDVVVAPQRTEPAPDEPSVADARVGFVDSSVREEHELEVGSAKIRCFTTASRLVAQEKAGKVEGGRGVLLLPDSDGDVAAEVADRLAFDADATVLYPDVDEEYDAAALLEAAAAFFAEQRVSATGAVGFGRSADAALLAAATFDAVVAWAPSSTELAAAATAPVCVFTASNAVELRDALDASKASDYVVRVVDDATDPRVEEQLLLGAAWLQLYLTVGDATTGPRAKSLWAD